MIIRRRTGPLLREIQTLYNVGTIGDLTDGQLLERFATDGGEMAELAFSALVERHEALVWHVCLAIVRDGHDAEDAFQATFLVLVRKAPSLWVRDSLGPWLHQVAYRTASSLRTTINRRRKHERRRAAQQPPALAEIASPTDPDRDAAIHDELNRLPEKYRAPLVLCDLEGRTHHEAARFLGWPVGTVKSRQSHARRLIRDRLARRGVGLALGSAVAGSLPRTCLAAIPRGLSQRTANLAMHQAGRLAASSGAAAKTFALTQGTIRAICWSQPKGNALIGWALAALFLGAGAAAISYHEIEHPGAVAPQQVTSQENRKLIVQANDTTKLTDGSSPVISPLPPREELRRLLRVASKEAVALATTHPDTSSWCLTTVATAQAKVGDLDGARVTFAAAGKEADGGFGGAASARNLWRVGHCQAECGLKEDSRSTLTQAAKALPAATGRVEDDLGVVDTYAYLVRTQATVGAREDVRRTLERFVEFSNKLFALSKVRYTRDWVAPKIAAAFAATGDFEAAFRWATGGQHESNALGEIADAASRTLDRDAARRFLGEVAARLQKLHWADQKYGGLIELARAQARLGDIEAARQTALSIGVGPYHGKNDMTDGQPYALICIAAEQLEAGDTLGARDTLEAAYRSARDHPKMQGRDGRFHQIVLGQLASGDIVGALLSAGAISGQRSQILAEIARAQAARGAQTTARATFAQALREAGFSVENPPHPGGEHQKPLGFSPKMSLPDRVNLAEIQAMAGDVTRALRTIRSMDEEFSERTALERVVSARATAGDVAAALRLCLEESNTPAERKSALQGLGEGLETRLSQKFLDPRD